MENYTDAALRHWQDANMLELSHRIENADQLYGLAAECALKSVLVQFPAFAQDGRLGVFHKQHINVLWGRMNHQSYHRSYPQLAAFLKASRDFEDWDVDQRYFANGHLATATLATHKEAARRVMGSSKLLGSKKK